MDAEWLATLATKDYLFPLAWPWSVWLTNLVYPVLIVWLYRRGAPRDWSRRARPALVAGSLALLGIFARLAAAQRRARAAGDSAAAGAHLLDARLSGDDLRGVGAGAKAARRPSGER